MKNHNEYVGGIPDVYYSAYPRDLWVEYKYLPIDKPRNDVIPNLSLKQLHWIKCRTNEGRSIWTIVGYKRGGVIYTDLHDMEFGLRPDDFLARTLSRKEIALEIEMFCTKGAPNETG